NAEFITKYFGKGQMIAIKGELHQRTFTDKDGNNRTAYDVVVDSASFCGNKEESKEPDVDYQNVDTSEYEEISMGDGDLPF
ncbi:MAG: single-stranded DNA-binding protein, partial [Acutalibacteraceae bacterium]